MWLGIVIALLIIGLVIAGGRIFFFYYLRPRHELNWYVDLLQTLGYKVIALPFQPFKIPLSSIHTFCQKQHKDAFYQQKNNWPSNDIVVTNTNNIVTLVLLKPRMLQAFFSPDKQPLFHKNTPNKIGFNILFKDSLILNEHEHWKEKRKIFTSVMNFDFIKQKIPDIVKTAQKHIDRISAENEAIWTQNHKKFTVNLKPYFEDIISDVVIGMFFGVDHNQLKVKGKNTNQCITQILNETRSQSNDWMVLLLKEKAYKWGVLPKYKKLNQKIQNLRNEVKKHLEQKFQHSPEIKGNKYSDLFSALRSLKHKNSDENLSIEEFISEFCAFMSASNDSTANYINMISYYLTTNKDIYSILQKILRKNFKSPEQMTYYKLNDMDYLEWCLLQTSRMYGPGTGILLRQAQQHTYIDNIPVMKDIGIRIQLLASHYNEKFYKEPFKFDPVRWQTIEPSPYTFGSFGFGAHTCLGKTLALLVAKITTAVLVHRFDKMQMSPESSISMVYKGTYQSTPFQTILWKPIERESKYSQEEADKKRYLLEQQIE